MDPMSLYPATTMAIVAPVPEITTWKAVTTGTDFVDLSTLFVFVFISFNKGLGGNFGDTSTHGRHAISL